MIKHLKHQILVLIGLLIFIAQKKKQKTKKRPNLTLQVARAGTNSLVQMTVDVRGSWNFVGPTN